MNWQERLDILRWRSLEEADAAAEFLSVDKRREATARTRGDLPGSAVQVMPARGVDAFLLRRCGWLEKETTIEKTRGAFTSMTVPSARWWWALAGWSAAFAAGFGLTGIGTQREINLLALPLVGLLLWNAVVMLGSVVFELMPGKGRDEHAGWLAAVTMRFATRTGDERGAHNVAFDRLAWPMAVERMKSRSRAWLHVAAALLALGSSVGMYAKGWSHEYAAVWESTLLKPNQAERFFSTLFWPASKTLDIEVPRQDVAAMQRKGGLVERAADALPWIHLYAATLLLLVVAPRLLLALWTRGRGAGRVEMMWSAVGWEPYARRLLRSIEGGEEVVQVLLYDVAGGDAALERWTRVLRDTMGGMSNLEFLPIPPGEEDEFAAEWVPQTHRVILFFQLATTPEEEVHAKLAGDLRATLQAKFADGRLVCVIDVAGVTVRWTAKHIESRRALWTQMLAGRADDIEFIGEEVGGNHLRVAVSKTR